MLKYFPARLKKKYSLILWKKNIFSHTFFTHTKTKNKQTNKQTMYSNSNKRKASGSISPSRPAGDVAPGAIPAAADITPAFVDFLKRGLDPSIAGVDGVLAAIETLKDKARSMTAACENTKLKWNLSKDSAVEGVVRFSSTGHWSPSLAESNYGHDTNNKQQTTNNKQQPHL